MWQDEILDEIHRIREEHAKSFNYDLKAMFADWQNKQAQSDRQVVTLQPHQAIADRLSRHPEPFLIVPLPKQQWIIVYKLLS